MSKSTENNTAQTTIDEVALRAQIETEMKAKIEAELRVKIEAEMKTAQQAKDEAIAKQEAAMEKTFAKQEQSVKAMLKAQKQVAIHIPENPNNPGEIVPVGFNGVIYAIPTGQDFEVPQSIYDTWKYAYDKTREANRKMDQLLNKEITIMD
jgi:hypothetical protein